MKRISVYLLAILLMGCSYGQERLESYLDDPQSIIQDPHYAHYQDNLDSLESAYLKKEITYSEYLEKKQQIEENYTYEVDQREQVIYGEK